MQCHFENAFKIFLKKLATRGGGGPGRRTDPAPPWTKAGGLTMWGAQRLGGPEFGAAAGICRKMARMGLILLTRRRSIRPPIRPPMKKNK